MIEFLSHLGWDLSFRCSVSSSAFSSLGRCASLHSFWYVSLVEWDSVSALFCISPPSFLSLFSLLAPPHRHFGYFDPRWLAFQFLKYIISVCVRACERTCILVSRCAWGSQRATLWSWLLPSTFLMPCLFFLLCCALCTNWLPASGQLPVSASQLTTGVLG